MDSTNSSNKSTPTLDDIPSSLTLSYLEQKISFTDYESLVENRRLEHELLNNQRTGLIVGNVIETIGVGQSDLLFDNYAKSSSSEAKQLGSSKKKKKHNFLSFENIIDLEEEEEEEESNNEDNYKKQQKKKKRAKDSSGEPPPEDYDDDDDDDDLEDPVKWQDFDIETLNFDKFIKDYQLSTANKNSKKSPTVAINNNDDDDDEEEEDEDEDDDDPDEDDYDDEETNSTIVNSTAAAVASNSKKFSNNKRKSVETNEEQTHELKSKRRRNKVLPIEIQGLMGEANLAFTRCETERAIDCCLEVIKYAPRAAEPYQLLSLLYNEMGQNDKALRVGLIAAQLNKDPDEWIELIQQALMEGDADLVLFCYNNAIQCDPRNIQLHIERLRLLEENEQLCNNRKRCLLAKFMLLKYVNVQTHLDVYEKYFQEVINELNDDTDRFKKMFVLKTDMNKFKESFAIQKLKLLIYLLIKQKSFKEAFSIILKQSKIRIKDGTENYFELNANDEENDNIFFDNLNNYNFEIPSTMHNYVLAQFIVCLIHLNYEYIENLLSILYKVKIENCSVEFLLIANTYYAKEEYKRAKRFFHLLLTNVKELLVEMDIWLKYGNCCSHLNEIEDAINAYRNAVNLDASNCEAALCLVNVLKKNSKLFDEASNVIKNTLSHKRTDILTIEVLNLVLSECFILYETQNYSEFIAHAKQILFENFKFVLEPENVNCLLKVDSKAQRAIAFHQMLEYNNFENKFNYNKLNREIQNNIFDIYLKLCKILVKLKRYDDLLMYTVASTVLPMVFERFDWNKSINFTCLIACILKQDGKNAFNIMKDFVVEFRNSNKLWSYVGIVIGLYPSLNQQKFFIRLGARFMDSLPLCLINAHFAIMSGTYRYALLEYINCFKQNPYDPFINLIIAITYCHISCQKYNTKRHLVVSQSLVFLRRYMKFRGVCQETYYNVARILHQLSLFDLASHYYQKCLEFPCFFPEQKEIYDLKRYAAYNLISIYKHSGSLALARKIMKEFITI